MNLTILHGNSLPLCGTEGGFFFFPGTIYKDPPPVLPAVLSSSSSSFFKGCTCSIWKFPG